MFLLVNVLAALLLVASVSSDCSTGWIPYSNTELCIKGFNRKLTYVESMDFCMGLGTGGSLVSIHNAFQNLHVATAADEADPNCNVWIGLCNIDGSHAYSWIDSSALDYQNWAPGYPLSDIEDTTVFLDTTGKNKWVSTYNLTETRCFVCQQKSGQNPQTVGPLTSSSTRSTTEKIPTTTRNPNYACDDGWDYYDGFCYFMNETKLYYQADAQAECDRRNSKLASILSSREQDFVNYFTSQKYAWIGLVRNDNWEWAWTDGSPLNYTNWENGHPYSIPDYKYVATVNDVWISDTGDDYNLILCKKTAYRVQ